MNLSKKAKSWIDEARRRRAMQEKLKPIVKARLDPGWAEKIHFIGRHIPENFSGAEVMSWFENCETDEELHALINRLYEMAKKQAEAPQDKNTSTGE